MRKHVFVAAFVALVMVAPVLAQDAAPDLVVAPGGQYATIEQALAQAHDGDVIEVRGGTYGAPLVIEKSVTLRGVGQPVIDAEGEGSAVFINAPDVTFEGFTIRSTGSNLEHEDTAITAQAPRAIIANNRLENVLFGIYFANAAGGIARDNVIHGLDLDIPARGDGIRVWYSDNVRLENNIVTGTRDTIIWYANGITITGNNFYSNRYGLHFMYSSDATLENNRLTDNSVGVYLMYSTGLTMHNNILANNRGPSGYGLGLKDMDGVVATNNLFAGNRAGIYVDNSPSLYEGFNIFRGNVFAYNDIGLNMLPSTERNVFSENVFIDNLQQASVHGRGSLQGNLWSSEGQGNFWSDYVGYDEDGDGIGDVSYRAEKLFDSLTDTYPTLQLFAFSPAAQAIDFASAAFPTLRPEPRLIDDAPLVNFHIPAALLADDTGISVPLLAGSAALMLVGGSIAFVLARPPREHASRSSSRPALTHTDQPMITATALTKRYGSVFALDHVSFTIEHGESVALWGANGAGKTTALRCLLGVLPFEGELIVNGVAVRTDGKSARAAIGYVPQEVVFYDMSVRDTLAFYARLKKVGKQRIDAVLNIVHLRDHQKKSVRALSGGMKQRLAMAVALLSDPPVLLFDEPTTSLDAQAQREFISMAKELHRLGKTLIFSSHHLDEVTALATRVLVLNGGRLESDTTPAQLVETLGMEQWLRIQVAPTQRSSAHQLLESAGYTYLPNGTAVYVQINGAGRMAPIRALEAADIPVEDFDLVPRDIVQDKTK